MLKRSLFRLSCLILLLAAIPSFSLASLQVTFIDERMGTSAIV